MAGCVKRSGDARGRGKRACKEGGDGGGGRRGGGREERDRVGGGEAQGTRAESGTTRPRGKVELYLHTPLQRPRTGGKGRKRPSGDALLMRSECWVARFGEHESQPVQEGCVAPNPPDEWTSADLCRSHNRSQP